MKPTALAVVLAFLAGLVAAVLVFGFRGGAATGTGPATPGGGSAGGGTGGTGGVGGKRLSVVATVGMVADVVRRVAGERAEVTALIGTGVDPHLYKPTRDDVLRLSSADAVFYAGLHLEGKMTDVLVRIARSKPVVAVSEGLPEAMLLKADGATDPHVWMDVSLWSMTVPVVVRELSALDPGGATGYAERGSALQQELAALHQYGIGVIASIPAEKRVLITSHDAFGYFGRAYGIEVRGVQGISTESEAGLKDINDLVDFLVQRKISAVFVESSVPRKNVEALIEGAKTRGHTVVIGGELFSDAMGSEGTYEGTYPGMLDHNLTLAARALGGTAPEQGHQGKLSPPK